MTQEDYQSVALAETLRAFVGKLKRRLREQADTADLPPSQIAVILRLERDGPMTTSALARAESMRPQSMGVVVAALESAGLVTGTPDPQDRRQTILSLTPQCSAWIHYGRAARQDWLARTIEARLQPHEQVHVASAITLLERMLNDEPAAGRA